MREKYESLSLVVLKDLAKARGLKGISTMKKGELIDRMLQEDEREKEAAPKAKTVYTARTASGQEGRKHTPKPRREEHSSHTEDHSHPEHGESMHAEHGAHASQEQIYKAQEDNDSAAIKEDIVSLDSGNTASGILEVMADGFGFIRCENYLPGEHDVYVAPSQIRRFNLKTGDIVCGNTKVKSEREKFSALLYVTSVNGYHPSEAQKRTNFEDLTPIFPNVRLRMERPGGSVAMRVMDIVSPIGKGQRGMIVSPPKAGKTTLLKEVAKSVKENNPEMHLIILLIDERPEEVTDIKEAIEGENVEVIYSTFDETAEHHKRVSEMVIERAKRLVENGQDVVILLDSLTRLARAYNLAQPASGRILSGGVDSTALYPPKKFLGAARNIEGGGSLTILASALIETGSKMDEVIFEEFKGTGNMEVKLDRQLADRRIFPAIDPVASGTRREDLLLDPQEAPLIWAVRRILANRNNTERAMESLVKSLQQTNNNQEFLIRAAKKAQGHHFEEGNIEF